MSQGNKARQIFQKTNIFYPRIIITNEELSFTSPGFARFNWYSFAMLPAWRFLLWLSLTWQQRHLYGNIFSREKYIKLYFHRYQTDLYPNFVQDDLFVKLYWWDYIVIPFVKEGIVQRDKFDVFNVNNQNTKAITRCYPAIFQVN